MRKLSALIISHAFPPDMGGASNRAWNIAKALSNNGHNVSVVAGFPYYPHGKIASKYKGRFLIREKLEVMDIYRAWIPGLSTKGLLRRLMIYFGFTLSYLVSLFALLRKRLDVLYYVSPYPLSFFSFPACIFGRLKRAVVLLDVADLWPEVIVEVAGIRSPSTRKILVVMARITSTLASFVTPITDTIREKTVSLGVPSPKLAVVELGVDTRFFKPKANFRIKDPRFESKFIVEYSGILSPKYDFAALLQAARIIAPKAREILFFIRGDGEQRDYILKSTERLNNVVVMTGMESPDRVVDYLNLGHVLVCPFRDFIEGAAIVPSKVLEYFAVAKPVVCSARGETETVINASRAGIIVAPEDPAALADSILRLYHDRDLCVRLGRNARVLAESRYSLENTAHRIESLYRAAVS